MPDRSPNILLIMADQLAPHFTGAYGHPVVRTPHIDALAARGTRFDAAYCNAPLCAPSRFSMMAGQLGSRIGAYDNASDFPASVPTFAHYLRSMGYHTCLTGKMHFVGPDQLHGFEERLTTDIYPADFAWVPDWENPDERIDAWYHNMDPVLEAGSAVATFQLDYDDEVAFTARRRLIDYARDRAEPFCLVASFMNPHDPYVALPEWWDLYADADIDLPATPLGNVEMDPASKRVWTGIGADTAMVTDPQILAARRAYYANTSFVDAKIGHLVETLEATGLLDNTVVIVTADHGDMLGERGLWYKMTCFERSIRVPLIIAGPDVPPGTVSTPCSLVDLLPTLLDLAGSDGRPLPEIADPLDGRSLMPLACGGSGGPDEVLGEHCAEMTGHPVLMIRRGRYKYIHCDSDPPMLFDLETDPEERTNLARHPAHQETTAAFALEVRQRWDLAALRADVIAKQKQRRAVHNALTRGTLTHWDYSPTRDASEEWVRNHIEWTAAADRSRFPPVKRER